MSDWENPSESPRKVVCFEDDGAAVPFVAEPWGTVSIPDKWDYAVPCLAPTLVRAGTAPAVVPKPEPAPVAAEAKPKASKK